MTTRRGFLGSILALAAAPAIVRADSLMKIAAPALWLPPAPTIEQITAEALRIARINLTFVRSGSLAFDPDLILNRGDVVTMRRPAWHR